MTEEEFINVAKEFTLRKKLKNESKKIIREIKKYEKYKKVCGNEIILEGLFMLKHTIERNKMFKK